MSTFKIPSIFTAVDKMSAPLRKMTAGVQQFTTKAEVGVARLDRRLRKLTPSLGGIHKQLFAFASAAAVGTLLLTSVQALKDYETNMASLSAITGVSGEQLEVFRAQVNNVAKDTKKSSVEVAKAFELVGSAKPELLKDAEALAEVTKQSIILSKASGDDLEVSVQSLAGTLNQFSLGADQAQRVINSLAAGSKEGAAAVPFITESLDKFGTVAASMNVSVEESVGLIETLAEKNIKGAEAGTKLRNVLTKMATAKALPAEAIRQLEKFGVNTDIVSDSSLSLETRLKELSKIQDDATALLKVFGTENLVAGQVLLQNVDKVKAYTDAVTGTNVAQEQAEKNSNTLGNRLDELSNAWVNMLTSNTAATGGLGIFKDLIVFVTDNLETIVGVIMSVVGVFAALKVIVAATRAGLLIYNVAMGVMAAVNGTAATAIGANSVAMSAYTAVQWLANAALWAFPLTWIVAAIVAVGAAIAGLIAYWDELVEWVQTSDNWFAKFLRGVIYPIIDGFKAIGAVIEWQIEQWAALVEWVKTSDNWFAKFIRGSLNQLINAFQMFKAGLSAIGDAFSTLWEWVKKFTTGALEPIFQLFDMMGGGQDAYMQARQVVNQENVPGADGEAKTAELVNPELAKSESITKSIEEKTNKDEVTIKVEAAEGTNVSTSGSIAPNVSSTTSING